MNSPIIWLASTVGKRGYIAQYLRDSSPRGSRVLGTGNNRYTPGFADCDESYLMRSIDDSRYLDDVLELCVQKKVDALVSLSDVDVLAISGIRDELTSLGVRCYFPNRATADLFGNKWLMFEQFSSAGLPTVKTWDPLSVKNEDELERQWTEHLRSSKLVVKPRCGSASRGITLVDNLNAVWAACDVVDEPIVQTYSPGRLVNVEVCSGESGKPLRACAWDRLVSVAGETGLTRTIMHEAAFDLVGRILQQFPIPGPIDVDLIEMPDGDLRVLEVNTRFGGGYPASHLAGADFVQAMLGDMNGQVPPEFLGYKEGIMMMKSLQPFMYDTLPELLNPQSVPLER